MSIESYYKSGYEIKRRIITNENGIAKETWSTAATISGRMRPLSGNEILANDKIGLKTTDRFYCAKTDIKQQDRINNTNTGKLYEIKLIKNPMEMDDHLEIDCEYQE